MLLCWSDLITESQLTPTVTSVRPNKGPIAGGTRLTIEGTYFSNFPVYEVNLAGSLSCSVNSSEQLTSRYSSNAFLP